MQALRDFYAQKWILWIWHPKNLQLFYQLLNPYADSWDWYGSVQST